MFWEMSTMIREIRYLKTTILLETRGSGCWKLVDPLIDPSFLTRKKIRVEWSVLFVNQRLKLISEDGGVGRKSTSRKKIQWSLKIRLKILVGKFKRRRPVGGHGGSGRSCKLTLQWRFKWKWGRQSGRAITFWTFISLII